MTRFWTTNKMDLVERAALAEFKPGEVDWDDPVHDALDAQCADEDFWQRQIGEALVAIASGRLSVTLGQGTALLHQAMELNFCQRGEREDDPHDIASIQAIGPAMTAIFDPANGHAAPRVLGADRMDSCPGDLVARFSNYVCYMFWDVAPYPYICGYDGAAACLDAMEVGSRSLHPAIVESALHGLGHAHECGAVASMEARRQRIIQQANTSISGFESRLQSYAYAAMSGCVL